MHMLCGKILNVSVMSNEHPGHSESTVKRNVKDKPEESCPSTSYNILLQLVYEWRGSF